MKLQEMDGKEIVSISWLLRNSEMDKRENFTPGVYERAYLSFEYHGDHAVEWIVVEVVATGKEVRRFNVVNLDTIEWKDLGK